MFLERTFMKSKNEYETGLSFVRKEKLSDIQIHIFKYFLQKSKLSLEALIRAFIFRLNERISPNQFLLPLPIRSAEYVEKIRTLIPDFEFFLKQYQCLVEEKVIDNELIQINSHPLFIGEILSMKSNKYLYLDDEHLNRIKNLFFSDQSHLYYVKIFEHKYHSLYNLITHENVKLEMFETYQIDTIKALLSDGYLKLTSEGYLNFKNVPFIELMNELHKKEVLSYWNYPTQYRHEMDSLIKSNSLKPENTLFTRDERKYLNYHLNTKEFTNGYDLRNKYMHGTNSFSKEEHEFDYHRLLKLIILTLIKIEDDIEKE